MAKEDLSLPVEMERLEIQPTKVIKSSSDENPFISAHQKRIPVKSMHTNKCPCQKKCKNGGINKTKTNKILKEPILKFLQKNTRTVSTNLIPKTSSIMKTNENLNVCALVDNCNQLSISSDNFEPYNKEVMPSNEIKWWTSENSQEVPIKKENIERSQVGSCSQEALNPPCDVTIDELASYFETLVHIPKKMSSMAEMMYI